MTYRADPSAPHVRFQTNFGSVTIQLFPDRAKKTVDNFLKYVRDGFYNNTLFHRIIDNFIVQGGGFEPGMIQKTTRPPIQNEATNGLRNERGTIAMARLDGDPHTATSQFFINTIDNDLLDHSGKTNDRWGYCVFGQVVGGMEVVERIEGVPTKTLGNNQYVPIKEVLLESMVLLAREETEELT